MGEAIAGLTSSDLDDLLRLYKHLHPEDEPLPARPVVEAVWHDMLALPGHHLLGARRGGELVGSCAIQVVPNLTRGARPYGLIENVVVHPDHRRRGMGARLLEHALDLAWDAGCYKVMLQTGTQNAYTRDFYSRVGFDGGTKRGFVVHRPRCP